MSSSAGFVLLVALASVVAGGVAGSATAPRLARSRLSSLSAKKTEEDAVATRLSLRGGGLPLVPLVVSAGLGITLKVNENLRERVINAFKHISFGGNNRRSFPLPPSLPHPSLVLMG